MVIEKTAGFPQAAANPDFAFASARVHSVAMMPSIEPIRINFTVPLPAGHIPRFVYCYLLLAGKVTLIDTGIRGADETIVARLRAAGRDPAELSAILLTHAHADHMGSAAALRALCPAPILAHAAEQRWIEDVSLQLRDRPVPGFLQLVAGSVKVDRVLREGDEVDCGGVGGRILHTPGHSPGGITLHLPALRTLFTGDAVPLPGDMPLYDDLQTYVRTVRRIMAIEGVERLYSAWHEPITDAASARAAMLASLDWLQQIHSAVRQVIAATPALEPMALCREVIGRLGLPPFAANPLVARSFQSHLRWQEVSDVTTLE